jgi:hypothetical protein
MIENALETQDSGVNPDWYLCRRRLDFSMQWFLNKMHYHHIRLPYLGI